jgi:phosphotransferase system HPr (HPr) family protein
MRVLLPDALHARPANLLVRLASQYTATITIRRGERCANAHKILDVLALGAPKGEEIDIGAEGEDAEAAAQAIADLIARNFDADLVPERGSGAVEGIAIGRALVVSARPQEGIEAEEGTTSADERAAREARRLASAEQRAQRGLDALIGGLPVEERALFEPERAILTELVSAVAAGVRDGASCEELVVALAHGGATDLIRDARARLLDALAGEDALDAALERASQHGSEVVVVAHELTPSLVARLPPVVRGIVAVDEEVDAGVVRTSHAAILARGREIPLAFVPAHVALAIEEGQVVVLDTTEPSARVWVAPGDALVTDARARRDARGAFTEASVVQATSRALGVDVLLNVSSLHDRLPSGVAGVGLLRTELLFAERATAPGENDQVAALLAVARAAGGLPVTVRLWDAGGDKPLPWLASDDPEVRGAALLFSHPFILETQVAAIVRAAARTPMRALIPMTRTASDVEAVRRLAPALEVGAMIETPEAARRAPEIARASDFLCIGTNDLAALVLGASRKDASQALSPRVLAVIAEVIEAARSQRRRVTVCGELAANPAGARILVGLGVDGLSVAPSALASLVRSLDGATIAVCRAAARAALEGNR